MPEFEVEIVLCKLDLWIPVLTDCSFFHRVTLYHSVRALLSQFFISFCTLCLGLSFTFPPFEYVLIALTCVVFTSFSQSPVSPQCGSALSVCLTLLCFDATCFARLPGFLSRSCFFIQYNKTLSFFLLLFWDIFGTYTDSPDFPRLRPKDFLNVSLLLIPPFPANIHFHGGF